jgi:beta-galactosidase
MAHILPQWNWEGREGEVTPVHVFTSGDEAELFLNGKSLGRKRKGEFEYRIRWDEVVYEPGELEVVAFKKGKEWARASVATTGRPSSFDVQADRPRIAADGKDLSFVTVRIVDEQGRFVRNAKTPLEFALEGPGEIVATDNGDPTSLVSFKSHQRDAFNGLCLVIVRGIEGAPGALKLMVKGEGVGSKTIRIQTVD